MTTQHEDDFEFDSEDPDAPASPDDELSAPRAKILIVDDDNDVHIATRHVLSDFEFNGVAPVMIDAYSSAEAFEILAQESDIAVVLLDVVMETTDAGLKLVQAIRETLGLIHLQILLRTGQPGNAPELAVMRDYNINGYLLKAELTPTKLSASLTSAIRAYDLLRKQDEMHQAIDELLTANSDYLGRTTVGEYALEMLNQAAALLGTSTTGLLLTCPLDSKVYRISVTTPDLASLQDQTLAALADDELRQRLETCLSQRESLIDTKGVTLFVQGRRYPDSVLHVVRETVTTVDLRLIELLKSVYAAAAENILLLDDVFRLAMEDALLRIPSRQALIADINERLKNKATDGVCLGIARLEKFSAFHQAHGYKRGNALLAALAQRLAETFPGALIARVGSRKLAVLGAAEAITPEALAGLSAEPVAIDGSSYPLTLSTGRILLAADTPDGEAALRSAEAACEGVL